MERKKWMLSAVLALVVAGGAISGCVTTPDGEQGVEAIESMSELDFNKWKLYVTLGTKIGANRLLAEGLVNEQELELTAAVLETVRDQSIVTGATSLLIPALEEAGLNNDEIELLLIIVEQELLSRGALEWVDPETGIVSLSPRTKELLTTVASSLRSAVLLTEDEEEQGLRLEAEFNGQIISQ